MTEVLLGRFEDRGGAMGESVVRAIQVQALRRPEAKALIGPGVDVTFAQLAGAVALLSQRLQEVGVGPGARVGICTDNCPECIPAMLAINAVGASFVPLSPRDPERRLVGLAKRANLSAVFVWDDLSLSGVQHHLQLAGLFDEPIAKPIIDAMVDLREVQPERLAYVIFTSGSTGEPKGVCTSHRAFWGATKAAADIMGFAEQTRSLAILPMHFDGSFSAVFPVLVKGGSVLVFRGPLCPPSTFCRLFKRFELTHTTITPTYLRAMMNEVELGENQRSWCTLALGGEAPPKVELQRLRKLLPSLKFFNRYGPTEATMAVATLEIDDAMLQSEATIPLGHPHPGVSFCIDGNPNELRPGQAGELWIGGDQLMERYLDDADSTARVLVRRGSENWLRTGDLVTVDDAGRYVFVERVDNVVKRNGTRIALAEVERSLNDLPSVVMAACVKSVTTEGVRIVAFVQAASEGRDEARLRQELLQELPYSMMPDKIVFLDLLPRASASKVDRSALERLGVELMVKQ